MPNSVCRRDFKQRSTERHRLAFPVSVCRQHSERSARIIDISTRGVGLELDYFLPIGEIVQLSLDTEQRVELRVEWQLGGRAGGSFLPPIPAAALATFLTTASVRDS